MATITFTSNPNIFGRLRLFKQRVTARGLWFGLILLVALVAFELFNFSTTEFALFTLFGDRDALGVATWASVLAIAFCGIDFAGLSRLFTPETGRKEPKEIWLLTGAWFLGAAMNAVMTWWAVGSALAANPNLGNEIASRADILHYGPLLIAGLVWLTRILIIGTFAFAGDHIFSTAEQVGSSSVVDGMARPVRSAAPRSVPKSAQTQRLPDGGYEERRASARPKATQRSLFGRSRADSSAQPTAAATPVTYNSTASTSSRADRAAARYANRQQPGGTFQQSQPAAAYDRRPAPVAASRSRTASQTRTVSNTQTVGQSQTRSPRQPVSSNTAAVKHGSYSAEGTMPQPVSRELEYVDFD